MMVNIYVVLDTSDITSENSDVDFSKLMNNASSVLRVNLDGTKSIVKYRGSKPDFLYGKTTYSHLQIKEIINDLEEGWIEAPVLAEDVVLS